MRPTDEDLEHLLTSLANTCSTPVPGHPHPRQVAAAVRLGVARAGGARVESGAPGMAEVPMMRTWIASHEDLAAFERGLVASVPQARMATPKEVACTAR